MAGERDVTVSQPFGREPAMAVAGGDREGEKNAARLAFGHLVLGAPGYSPCGPGRNRESTRGRQCGFAFRGSRGSVGVRQYPKAVYQPSVSEHGPMARRNAIGRGTKTAFTLTATPQRGPFAAIPNRPDKNEFVLRGPGRLDLTDPEGGAGRRWRRNTPRSRFRRKASMLAPSDSAFGARLHAALASRARPRRADAREAWTRYSHWWRTNAMVCISRRPHGLEQYNRRRPGAVRDVCQGPIELLLSLEHTGRPRGGSAHPLPQQYEKKGGRNWPQWFML